MTQRPPASESDPSDMPSFDVGAAVDALFDEILKSADNPHLNTSIALLREETLAIRAYEADWLPGREAEYQRLLDCWRRKDKQGLRRELMAYYQRREDISDRVARGEKRPN